MKMSNPTALQQIESLEQIQDIEVSAAGAGGLKVVVEAHCNQEKQGLGPGPISPLPESVSAGKTFELRWPTYAAYFVTEAKGRSAEQREITGVFTQCRERHFLEYVLRDVRVQRGQLLHYRIIGVSRVVDIAAYAPPEVRVITRSAQKKLAARHIGGIIGPY